MNTRIARKILKHVREKIGSVFSFKELIQNKKDKYDVVVTFISLFEMAKERVIGLEQKSNYSDIQVFAGERVNENTVLDKYKEGSLPEGVNAAE